MISSLVDWDLGGQLTKQLASTLVARKRGIGPFAADIVKGRLESLQYWGPAFLILHVALLSEIYA
jgi:hypothetical protein